MARPWHRSEREAHSLSERSRHTPAAFVAPREPDSAGTVLWDQQSNRQDDEPRYHVQSTHPDRQSSAKPLSLLGIVTKIAANQTRLPSITIAPSAAIPN
ncbi:hypothetical protein D8S78_21510 [Natrialba swarupiae]|nr:hypothetical protein [Natrialba swarupiae]